MARKEYKILLTQVKTTKIKEKIDDCHKDTKKLYKLVVYLTGTATENLLPPGKTDNQLAEDFAKFFMNKIQTIRDNLADHPLYKPEPTNIPKFDTFKKLSEEDVRKLISKMKTKSCEFGCSTNSYTQGNVRPSTSNHHKNDQFVTYTRYFH